MFTVVGHRESIRALYTVPPLTAEIWVIIISIHSYQMSDYHRPTNSINRRDVKIPK